MAPPIRDRRSFAGFGRVGRNWSPWNSDCSGPTNAFEKIPFGPVEHPIKMGKVKDFLAGPFRDSRAMAATLVVLLVAPGLPAYEVPLSPASLHDAWVLGQRNDQATAEFLTPCLKQITEGSQGGPHIAEIEVLTPFSQVVDQSRQNLSGYTEQQAAQDYRQRGDMVVVRVLLMLPSAFPKRDSGPAAASPSQEQKTALRPENFWQNFRFNVKQQGKILATRSVHNKPVYSAPTKDSPSVLDGATVWLEYDAKDVRSEPATVEVTTPDAKTIAATFDLQKLR